MKCCICECNIQNSGNNPFPICGKEDYESRCCDECNSKVILARIAMSRDDKDIHIGDTIVIFYSSKSNSPIENIKNSGKFLAGIVESITENNKNIEYKGTWGNFTLDSKVDQFVKI